MLRYDADAEEAPYAPTMEPDELERVRNDAVLDATVLNELELTMKNMMKNNTQHAQDPDDFFSPTDPRYAYVPLPEADGYNPYRAESPEPGVDNARPYRYLNANEARMLHATCYMPHATCHILTWYPDVLQPHEPTLRTPRVRPHVPRRRRWGR